MFFIGFHILPQVTTSIGYNKPNTKPSKSSCRFTYRSWYLIVQTCYPSRSCFFEERFFFKNLDSMTNKNFTFDAKYAEFSTKRYAILHFHNPTCSYNQRYNLHQRQFFFFIQFSPTYFTLTCSQNHPYNAY